MHHWSGPINDSTDEWLPQWWHDTAWPTLFSVAVSVRPDYWCIFYTHYLAVVPICSKQLDSHVVNLGARVEVRYIMKFISVTSQSMAAHVRQAFQDSQGSVETLFRWGGKRSHDFCHIFWNQCTNFHQNGRSFIEDITKKILVSFFSGHTVQCIMEQSSMVILLIWRNEVDQEDAGLMTSKIGED